MASYGRGNGRFARKSSVRANAIRKGYKSGLEGALATQIEKTTGAPARYETLKLRYTVPASDHTYTPDFILDNGIIVESKGYWEADDRKKMALIKEQHPSLDIRMVFTRPEAPIRKGSKTTYAMVCDKLGIPYAKKEIPLTWFLETSRDRSASAVPAVTVSSVKKSKESSARAKPKKGA